MLNSIGLARLGTLLYLCFLLRRKEMNRDKLKVGQRVETFIVGLMYLINQ